MLTTGSRGDAVSDPRYGAPANANTRPVSETSQYPPCADGAIAMIRKPGGTGAGALASPNASTTPLDEASQYPFPSVVGAISTTFDAPWEPKLRASPDGMTVALR